jgi:hypothetical protein
MDMNALTGNISSSGGNPVRDDIPVENNNSKFIIIQNS